MWRVILDGSSLDPGVSLLLCLRQDGDTVRWLRVVRYSEGRLWGAVWAAAAALAGGPASFVWVGDTVDRGSERMCRMTPDQAVDYVRAAVRGAHRVSFEATLLDLPLSALDEPVLAVASGLCLPGPGWGGLAGSWDKPAWVRVNGPGDPTSSWVRALQRTVCPPSVRLKLGRHGRSSEAFQALLEQLWDARLSAVAHVELFWDPLPLPSEDDELPLPQLLDRLGQSTAACRCTFALGVECKEVRRALGDWCPSARLGGLVWRIGLCQVADLCGTEHAHTRQTVGRLSRSTARGVSLELERIGKTPPSPRVVLQALGLGFSRVVMVGSDCWSRMDASWAAWRAELEARGAASAPRFQVACAPYNATAKLVLVLSALPPLADDIRALWLD